MVGFEDVAISFWGVGGGEGRGGCWVGRDGLGRGEGGKERKSRVIDGVRMGERKERDIEC